MRLFKSGHKLRLAGAVAKAVAIINTSNGGSIQTLLQLSSHSHLQREGKTVVGHGCSMGDVRAVVSPNFAKKNWAFLCSGAGPLLNSSNIYS